MTEKPKYFEAEPRHIVLNEFDHTLDWILDFGGGGEGIIGQLMGAQVVAIDRLESELKEAHEAGSKALPIIMDGTDLKFPENTFKMATSFYALMYVGSEEDLTKIFTEIYRVLKPEGEFIIWESEFENPLDSGFNIIAFELKVDLPSGKMVETGYGTKKRKQSKEDYIKLAKLAGFKVDGIESEKSQFVLHLKK